MQLSDIQCLTKDYTSNDVNEIGAVMQSTFLASPSGQIRWGKVKDSDAQEWINNSVAASLKDEFKIQRMSVALDLNDGGVPPSACAEHLIIRDYDMEHVGTALANDIPGYVVAHADWRYTPSFDGHVADTPTGVNSKASEETFPKGFNIELHNLLSDGIASSIAAHFHGLPFFYLLGISTLTPSHLRKGIAKRLVQWVEPYIDHYNMPSVLYASPLGTHLYRSCGYQEYRDLDIAVDLRKWDVDDTHRHVLMIRWPQDESRLSDAWKEWRKTHREGQSTESVDTT